jgi:phospholipid/cholesterol/gamma-HCH transport system substrate-binding protein
MLFRPIHVLVGSLVLLLVIGISGIGLWLNFHPRSRATVPYVLVTQGTVNGIRPGAPVFLRGVLVGGVRSVRFAPGNPRLIQVRITVLPGTPIFQGAYAEISVLGLSSDLRAIELFNQNTQDRPLVSAIGYPALIPIRAPAPDPFQMQARQALQGAHVATGRAQQVMGEENRAHLDRLQQNLHTMTAQADAMQRQWHAAKTDLPALGSEARQTMAQARQLQANATAAATLLGQHTKALGQTVTAATQQLNADRRRLQIQWQESLTPGYSGTVRSAREAQQGMRALSQELRERPQVAWVGKPADSPDPGEPGFKPEEQTAQPENPEQP